MQKSVQITLIIVAAVIVLALIGTYVAFQVIPTGNTVQVNGQSQIKAVPDLVGVYFNVETNGTTAKEAKDKNSAIVDSVVTALVKQGFNRDDIQTLNFNIYPDYRWENGRNYENGYKAVHTIRVEVSTNNSDKIGSVIDAGVDSGALISYINFELSVDKQNEYKTLALKQATEDARIKADAIASGLGMKVGRLVSISTSEFYYQPWNLYTNSAGAMDVASEAKSATTTIQPGEQDVNAQVRVVYALK